MADSDAGGYDFALYRYTPSLPAAITATAIFGILTVGHLWRMLRSRTWFCLPFAIGGVCEFLPFSYRIATLSATVATATSRGFARSSLQKFVPQPMICVSILI